MLPRRPGIRLGFLPLILLGVLVIEELLYGQIFIWHMNRYDKAVVLPITVVRNSANPSIAIVVILKDDTHRDEYDLAQQTLQCYAALQGYGIYIIDASASTSHNRSCPQKDFMFKRHCVLRRLMSTLREEWILFLDADMGVINPNHLIEEYLPRKNSVHIVLYDRVMNHEVMAGSYLLRNSEISRRFLKNWADAEFSLPESFHGTDNGALHMVLLETALPQLRDERQKCRREWEKSRNFDELSRFEVCTRLVTAGRELEGIEIRNKTNRHRWSRDGWLTENVWSPADFILHGWQKRRRDRLIFARWHSPLAALPASLIPADRGVPPRRIEDYCKSAADAAKLWQYKDSFMDTDEKVQATIGQSTWRVDKEFREIANRL